MSKRIKDALDALPSYWRLATIRCAIYASIVGWGVWKAGVNGFATLDDMTSIQFWQLVGDVLMSMAAVWLSFVDQTMAKVERRDTNVATPTVQSTEPKPEEPKP